MILPDWRGSAIAPWQTIGFVPRSSPVLEEDMELLASTPCCGTTEVPAQRRRQCGSSGHSKSIGPKEELEGQTDGHKPLVVIVDPGWLSELGKPDVAHFFREAHIAESHVAVLQGRFEKFASRGHDYLQQDAEASMHLTIDDFHHLNEHYKLCKPSEEEHFFRAMDRTRRFRLCFNDFLLGCCAASPATPHILNGCTGLVRARFIFDYYNVSRSGTLDDEELARLLGDARGQAASDMEARQRKFVEIAQELGNISAVTLRVGSMSGDPLCELRVSTRWTGHKVLHEIARELSSPIDSQRLVIGPGPRLIGQDECLADVLPPNATSASVMLVAENDAGLDVHPICRGGAVCVPAASPSRSCGRQVPGVERLVHITFESFYLALQSERLRGTSVLFRFQRCVLRKRLSRAIDIARGQLEEGNGRFPVGLAVGAGPGGVVPAALGSVGGA